MSSEDIFFDLLQEEVLFRLSTPGNFRKEIEFHQTKHEHFKCIIDEVQAILSILNEIHSLIESTSITFIATGSSARKLKRFGTNLTAGRMLSVQIFPLIYQEITERFNLDRALIYGMLPNIWNKNIDAEHSQFLISYSNTYLKHEILEEGLVRNIAPFAKFIELVGHENGELVNYSRILFHS